MQRILLLLLLTAVACRKTELSNESPDQHEQPGRQVCDFGLSQFNTTKQPFIQEQALRSEVRQPGDTAVLLLDFDGHTVSNTLWNSAGPIVCSPANLSSEAIDEIVKRVTEDFSPFEILVTTNEGTYELCDPAFRMRVILTESWEWFGQWGGTSLMGSFTWGNNTPCFVFSLLLNYQAKKIAEAASHEAGHTLGLYHQSLYSPGCVLLSEYYSGIGSGELGWAPIMGVGYYRNMTTWWKGKTNIGCNNIQDDLNIINNVLDIRVDDHNKLFPHATPIGLNGIDARLNSDSDEDKFFVDLPSGKILTVAPFNIGNNIGGNIDILVRIYSANKTLLATINDPNSLSIATTLNAGKYYISVESVENANTSRYGQLGNYSVRFN